MEPEVGVVVSGRYELRRALGRGGMGSVWMAYDKVGKESVAVKFLSPEYAAYDDARVRFEREALEPQRIKSPYVVTIKGQGIDDGTPYIVMELLQGEDLLRRIHREGRMSMAAAGKLITQLAEGLQEAHKLGITHRDLKPGNIFLARVGNEEIPKIVDFGIAKAQHTGMEEEATKKGMILGSLNYISPEQLRSSKDVDHRSDVWSLAVILLRLITGKMPFQSEGEPELVLEICSGRTPVPSLLAPELDLPLELDEYFERALNRDRTRRFQTAMEMAEQFNRFLIGLPSDPPSSTEPLVSSGPRAAERLAALADLENAAQRISSAFRREAPVADEEATRLDRPSGSAEVEVREVSTTLDVAAHTGRGGRGAGSESAEKGAVVDDEASTHLKIDVDFDAALRAAEAKRRGGAAAPTAGSKATEAKARRREAQGRSSIGLTVGMLIAVLVVLAGAVGAWRFMAGERENGGAPKDGAQAPEGIGAAPSRSP
jgi:serine/threonine protein kinase